MALADLQSIRDKTRALVAAPTSFELSDAKLDNYINSYYLYDFPQQLRILKLQTVYELPLIPGQNTYTVPWDQFMSFSQPCYVSQYETQFYMDRTTFYRAYPIYLQQTFLLGDGTTGPYTTTLGYLPITPGTVYVSATDAGGVLEESTDDTNGNLPNLPNSSVNYVTGEITLNFRDPIPAGQDISIQYNAAQYAFPQALLLYDSQFIVAPVPNISYLLTLNAYYRPTALIAQSQFPILPDWWQALAFGAAKKIFEERMDMDQLQKVLPMLKEQLLYCQRTTLVELSQQRPKTPYSGQLMYQAGQVNGDGSWWWFS